MIDSSNNWGYFFSECRHYILSERPEPKKKINFSYEDINITAIITKMQFGPAVKFDIPSRIFVCPSAPKVQQIFKKYMWQPPLEKWDHHLWVFRSDPNVLHQPFQYELRFFENEEDINKALKEDDEKYELLWRADRSFTPCPIF